MQVVVLHSSLPVPSAFLQKANCCSITGSLSVAFFLETNTSHKQNLTNLSDLWSGWAVETRLLFAEGRK